MTELVPTKTKMDTIKKMADTNKEAILRALPKFFDIDRFIQIWATCIRRSEKLLECTPISLVACLITSAQLGLELDPLLGEAFLVPFKKECQLIIGYRGLMKLARNSETIASMEARVVYDKDRFQYEYGLEPKLIHVPHREADRGDMVACYAIAKFKGGGSLFEIMEADEIDAIKQRSPAFRSESGPWITDEAMMWRKSAIRRFSRYLPADPTFQRAAALDERAELGIPQELDVPFDVESETEEEEKSKLDNLKDRLTTEKNAKDIPPAADTKGKEKPLPPGEQLASPTSITSVMDVLGSRNIAWEPPDDLTQGEAMQIIGMEKERDVKKINAKLQAIDHIRETQE